MAYTANQYNYATPLSSANQITLEPTSGRQMLDFDAWVSDMASRGGVVRGTYTIDSSLKSITITATENDAFTPYGQATGYFSIPAKPNTKYTLTCQRSGATVGGRVFLFENGTTGNFVENPNGSTNIVISLTTTSAATFLTFRVGVMNAGQTSTFTNIMICEGEAASWERYNDGLAYPPTDKYFGLANNTLDGSYKVITGDVGLWGTSVSDASGVLANPYMITVEETLSLNAIRVLSNFVDFTIKLYNGSVLAYSINEVNNSRTDYIRPLPYLMQITKYEITATKVNVPGDPAKIYAAVQNFYVKREESVPIKLAEQATILPIFVVNSSDNLVVKVNEPTSLLHVSASTADTVKVINTSSTAIRNTVSSIDSLKAKLTEGVSKVYSTLVVTDTIKPKFVERSAIRNTIDVTRDTLNVTNNAVPSHVISTVEASDTSNVKLSQEDLEFVNIHSIMKSPYRQVFGKVYITYTDPMLDTETTITGDQAYNSNKEQLLDGQTQSDGSYFTLFDNDLSGQRAVMTEESQVGWVSPEVSNENGEFGYYKTGCQLLDHPYDASNKFTLTATRDDHYTITDYKVYLEAGRTYTASFESTGSAPYDVEVFLLLNKQTDTYVRVANKTGYTFVASASGWYYLRLDVNIAGTTHSIWNVMLSEGSYANPYEPYTETYVDNPTVSIAFSTRPIVSLKLSFDDSHGGTPKDFIVSYIKADDTVVQVPFVDNTETQVSVPGSVPDVKKISITVTKVNRPHSPAAILEIPVSSTILYKGYDNVSDLMSIDLLEELTYIDEVEALGGVSANEITISLDNSSRDFFFNSGSVVANQLLRNRKIEPYLGAEVIPGEIEWYSLGVFWAYKWQVPVNGLTATVVGFDTLGLLNNTQFINYQTQVNKSLGELIEYILADAENYIEGIQYVIEESLYDIVIPYAWFGYGSHTAALRKISECFPVHIYCDRQGRICAAPQKLHLDFYYDKWADNTNVIDKEYSSLYTALPNIVNVKVHNPVVIENEELIQDEAVFDVSVISSRVLSFSAPYLSDIVVDVDCDNTVAYTYNVYSWGLNITFTGTGTVRSITCTGTCVNTTNESIVTRRDDQSVRLNGAITRDIELDFIQNTRHAVELIDRLFSLSANDKYDVKVNYRGDIALSINDPILLIGGIAPDNRYNIKRHQLNWNGFLTGSAELNT